MGTNVSTVSQIVSNELSNTLSQTANSSAIADCKIQNNINASLIDGCQIISENKCTADSSASMGMMADAIITALAKMSEDQTTQFLGGLGVSTSNTDIRNEIKNKLEQTCVSNATSRAEIANNFPLLKVCRNSVIKSINTGNATGNCAINMIMKAAIQADEYMDKKQTSENMLGTIFAGISNNVTACITGCFCIIIIYFACCVVLYFMSGNHTPSNAYHDY